MSSIISSLTSDTNVQTLAASLIESYDSDADGRFSAGEFSNFLNDYVDSLTGQATTATSSSVGTTALTSLDESTDTSSADETSTTTATSTALPDCLRGWNREKWVDSTHTTIKYVAGRIMAQYKPSDWLNADKQAEIVAKFEAAGLTPTIVDEDEVDFGDGAGAIDIVTKACQGGTGWQWHKVNAD